MERARREEAKGRDVQSGKKERVIEGEKWERKQVFELWDAGG